MVIFIVWIAIILLQQQKKIQCHKRVCGNKVFCIVVMPSEDTKMLELNQNQKSDKALFIILAYLECMIEKIDGCKNNPAKSSFIELIKCKFGHDD